MTEYKSHPLAEIFPLMPASDIKELSDDIRQRGLQNPITLHDGKILDGRHRYEACLIAEVEPRFEEYKGDDPVGYVIAANLKRRHLTVSQKAMVAAAIADLKPGGDRKSEPKNQTANLRFDHQDAAESEPKNQTANLRMRHRDAAEILAVSPRSVDTASKIMNESPKLAKQVANGKISLHAAEQKLKSDKSKLEEQLDKTGWPIPQKIQADWDAATATAREPMSQISKMKSAFEDAQNRQTPMFNEVVIAGAIMTCKSLYGDWKTVLPYAVCPTCQGKAPQSCGMCRRRGYVSEFFWNRCVLPEMKAMREKILASKRVCK